MTPQLGPADTIRILVATDNHVGAHENDAERENDSWRTFEEILVLARERDVDMVLLAGDLFHDNKPSRQSMYNVMRILRSNCLGEKPCELQMVSDKTEAFEGVFDHVNYEDPDINVSLPVFSIHGNHDDPSGTKMLASLDLLQVSGLVNYYGRTPESDDIEIRPVLLQKGRTKLALYGMSNVRDERLYRTFRDGKVKFFRPSTQQSDWFSIMSVHQNHHAYTEKGYLPEEFIPSFMDLVVWGHEHECKINPIFNPEMGFHVMQPGSSIATSLSQSETVEKHVAIVSVVGRKFDVEPIRLKTVRPFVMRQVVLMDDPVAKKVMKKENNRVELTKRLTDIVNDMIKQANQEWLEMHGTDSGVTVKDAPKPLIRLRVEYTAPEGSKFDLENPQRFSNRFQDRIANKDDVVQFHRRKKASTLKNATATVPDQADDGSRHQLDSIKVDKLVRQFLEAQSLTILPQNSFGDAVSQFVNKDDRHAMEFFVQDALSSQVDHLLALGEDDEDEVAEELAAELERNKAKMEQLFAKGQRKRHRASKLKPEPEGWNAELDGEWADQPGAMFFSEHSEQGEDDDRDEDEGSTAAPKRKGRGTTTTTKKPAASKAPKTSKIKKRATSRNKYDDDDDDDDDGGDDEADEDDVMIIEDDDDDENNENENAGNNDEDGASSEGGLFVQQTSRAKAKAKPKAKVAARAKPTATTKPPTKSRTAAAKATKAATPPSSTPARRATTRSSRVAQSQQSSIAGWARNTGKPQAKAQAEDLVEEISSDSDDDGAFEPMKPVGQRR